MRSWCSSKRVHGPGVFTRGQTQVISTCTLGIKNDEQILESLSPEDSKRWMHHYNFPPFSVGEIGRMGTPGRREIGHGALGERALSYVLPSYEELFPMCILEAMCVNLPVLTRDLDIYNGILFDFYLR